MKDPREDRLPAWARSTLRTLREENAALRAAVDGTGGPTPVRGVDPATGIVTPIPSGRVRFDVTPPTVVTTRNEVVRLRRQEGWIEANRADGEGYGAPTGVMLHGPGQLAVVPVSSTDLYVHLASSARLPEPALAAWRGEEWPPEVTTP